MSAARLVESDRAANLAEDEASLQADQLKEGSWDAEDWSKWLGIQKPVALAGLLSQTSWMGKSCKSFEYRSVGILHDCRRKMGNLIGSAAHQLGLQLGTWEPMDQIQKSWNRG
jgi:hypothetical protein